MVRVRVGKGYPCARSLVAGYHLPVGSDPLRGTWLVFRARVRDRAWGRLRGTVKVRMRPPSWYLVRGRAKGEV